MNIALIFATHNGESSLHQMLESLKNVEYSVEQLSIIAVNNNSTDQTQSILESYLDQLPLKILFESKQGKSYAVNAGLQHIPEEADLVILTDDDVIADPQWFSEFEDAARKNPDYDIFGGEIKPAWEVEPEPWILQWVNCSMVFAINEGQENGEIDPELIFGPNSAFRAHLLHGDNVSLQSNLGPKANTIYPMGNDTALSQFFADKGCKAFHVPKAVVWHIVPRVHLTEDWILKRAERYGWGQVLLEKAQKNRVMALISYWFFTFLYFICKPMPKSWLRYKILYGSYYYKGILRGLGYTY